MSATAEVIRRLVDGGMPVEEAVDLMTRAATERRSRKSDQATTRGSRLPADWKPSPEDQSFARQYFYTDIILAEFEKFRDYWTARAGAGGIKLDWSATWRNWIRKEANQRGIRATKLANMLIELCSKDPEWEWWKAFHESHNHHARLAHMHKCEVEGGTYPVPSRLPPINGV